jgi:hypothetical protein
MPEVKVPDNHLIEDIIDEALSWRWDSDTGAWVTPSGNLLNMCSFPDTSLIYRWNGVEEIELSGFSKNVCTILRRFYE